MKTILALLCFPVSVALAADPAALVRRDEMRMMNQVVPTQMLGSNLRVWDGAAWRTANPSEFTRTQAKVLVVNLWATYCKPCVSEFPVLREMARRIESEYKQDVQFLFLSETSDPIEMKAFCSRNERVMLGKFPLFLDDNENVASSLRSAQPGGNLAMPTTIILDEQRSVRYAMIGAVLERRSELVNAIEDTVRSVKQRTTK